MLNREIGEFLETLDRLTAIGCLLFPEADREAWIFALKRQAEAPNPAIRIPCFWIRSKGALPSPLAPALWMVSEEEYSEDFELRRKIHAVVGYFLNLR